MRAIATTSIFAILAASALAQDFHINTPPALLQCIPVSLSWTGGTPPYNLFVIAPGNPADILEQLGSVSGTSFVWHPNLPVGTQCAFQVIDASGNPASSAGDPIQVSSDNTCLNGAPGGSGSSSAASSGSTGSTSGATTSSTSSTSTSTSTTSTPATTALTNSTPATTTTAATHTSTGAAANLKANLGGAVALLLGAAALV